MLPNAHGFDIQTLLNKHSDETQITQPLKISVFHHLLKELLPDPLVSLANAAPGVLNPDPLCHSLKTCSFSHKILLVTTPSREVELI